MAVWKVVHDAPNYEVSNEGQVRNRKNGRIIHADRGRVALSSYGQVWRVQVNELVSRAFSRIKEFSSERWARVECAWEYEVSDRGNVRNRKTGKVLKPYPNNHTGRPQVTLIDGGYRITRPVHRIMEEAFGRVISDHFISNL